MIEKVSRRSFVGKIIAALVALPAGRLILSPASAFSTQQQGKKDKGPRLDPKMVEEFVAAAHGNLDRVKEMLAAQPALVNATWDWGSGDWETGLGGAAHMGRRDIALYLLDHNARIDIFAAAMLGKLEVVKTLVAAFPGVHNVPGPHGIPLIKHAEKGGKDAEQVLEYLKTLESA